MTALRPIQSGWQEQWQALPGTPCHLKGHLPDLTLALAWQWTGTLAPSSASPTETAWNAKENQLCTSPREVPFGVDIFLPLFHSWVSPEHPPIKVRRVNTEADSAALRPRPCYDVSTFCPRKWSHECPLCLFPGNRRTWPQVFLLILMSVTRLKEYWVWGRKQTAQHRGGGSLHTCLPDSLCTYNFSHIRPCQGPLVTLLPTQS